MNKDDSDIKRIITDDADIKKMLNSQKVSRRDFLTFAGAMGMTAAMGSSLWSNKAIAAGPVRGGHMVVGLNGAATSDSLDSTQFIDTYMISISRAIRDSLVDVGQDNSATPALAESWESSPDAKVWRFKIRQGVEFANGKPLTLEDIVASINVHRGEDTTSAAAGVFAGISDVSTEGKDTVVVSLSSANADAPFLFTDYHFQVVPSKDGKPELFSKHGTGAYVLKEYEPGIKSVIEKNPNAWQADQTGWVDSAEIVAVLDDTARQSALISGSVDVINRPALKTVNRLKRVKGMNIIEAASNLAYTHPMFTDVAPFDNIDLRKALSYSLPRKEFVDKILFGYGTIGNDQPLGPQFNSYDSSIAVEYDLDKAKHHIKKAGLDGTKFDFSASDAAYGGSIDAAQLFQQSWEKIGLKPNLVREPQDGYWSNVWNQKPFCACYWGPRPVEDLILSIAYMSESPWNDTRIAIPRVDELVVSARGELDQAKRKAMYSEVQQLISDNSSTLIPAFGSDVAAVNDTIGIGPQLGGGWEMDGGHFLKRWWKKA